MGLVWNSAGHLRPGRKQCSVEYAHEQLVAAERFVASTTRRGIWEHWLSVVEATRELVGEVCCAWLGGSFTSTKLDPDDIDTVFVVESTRLDRVMAAADDRAQLLAHIAESNLRNLGLRVDSYVLAWVVNPQPAPVTPEADQYMWNRGYWDDFWQRVRSGGKGDPPCRRDALPLRGYLEVILDGFPEQADV